MEPHQAAAVDAPHEHQDGTPRKLSRGVLPLTPANPSPA